MIFTNTSSSKNRGGVLSKPERSYKNKALRVTDKARGQLARRGEQGGIVSDNSVAILSGRSRLRFLERLSLFYTSTSTTLGFMVLLDQQKRVSGLTGGQAALRAACGAASLATIASIFFNLCEACISEVMASIPPSAFSAGRIRETQQEMKVSNVMKGNEPPQKYFNTKFMELSPLKYNSKLMNSIWGFYNRYSPHNVKKVSEANGFSEETQQSAAVFSTKNEPVLTLPTQLDNMWAAINASQSH